MTGTEVAAMHSKLLKDGFVRLRNVITPEAARAWGLRVSAAVKQATVRPFIS